MTEVLRNVKNSGVNGNYTDRKKREKKKRQISGRLGTGKEQVLSSGQKRVNTYAWEVNRKYQIMDNRSNTKTNLAGDKRNL